MYPHYGQSNAEARQSRRQAVAEANDERLTVGVGEPRERLQVGQALAALDPPGPLPPDGRTEAELERGVEVLVGVAEHAPQQAVDVRWGDRGQRQPPRQVHVAHLV